MSTQYEYDYGPDGVLAPLQERSEYPDSPYMISPPFGWVDIVVALDTQLAALVPDYTIVQVKEKFAGLRYYIGSWGVADDDPRIGMARDLIAEAEHRSMSTCQVCGQTGRVRTDASYMATLCDKHNS